MPESWEPVAIGGLGRIVTGSTPKTANAEYYAKGKLHFNAPGDISDVTEIMETAKKITDAGMRVSRPLSAGRTCVVCIGSTFGKVRTSTQKHTTTNTQNNSTLPSADYHRL